MTRVSQGARSRRACRGCPERPSKEASDGRFLADRRLWRACPPKLQRRRDNGEHGPGPEIPRGAPKGERPFAGTTRRLNAGGVWLPRFAHIERGHGGPVVRNE